MKSIETKFDQECWITKRSININRDATKHQLKFIIFFWELDLLGKQSSLQRNETVKRSLEARRKNKIKTRKCT